MSWAELKGEILHCVSCKKALKIDWEEHKYYQISDPSIMVQERLRMEYRSGSPEDDFLYYHRVAICQKCLERHKKFHILKKVYILEENDPFWQMADSVQAAAAAFDNLQERYADDFFRLIGPDKIRELTNYSDPHGKPSRRLKDLKNRLMSMVGTEYEKSPEFVLHKQQLETALTEFKRKARLMARYDLWTGIFGNDCRSLNPYIETEDTIAFPASDDPYTGFYSHCASAQEVYEDLEEMCRDQLDDRGLLTKAAKLCLRDMPAFLRDRGIDPDTLFSGGSSASL